MPSIIDLNDSTGELFLNDLINNTPSLLDYITNATNGKFYDFKAHNGAGEILPSINHYRGMSIGGKYIASARDIGNIGAGYIAGVKGIPYFAARFAFDLYQSYSDTKEYYKKNPYVDSYDVGIIILSKEGIVTTNAERVGWVMGRKHRKIK